jgi:hypothetical protein
LSLATSASVGNRLSVLRSRDTGVIVWSAVSDERGAVGTVAWLRTWCVVCLVRCAHDSIGR